MRRSLVMGLLSVTVLASMVSPSYSEDLNANPSQGEQSGVRLIADNSGAAEKGASVNRGLFRIARADRGDRRFAPHLRDGGEARQPDHGRPDGELHDRHDPELGLAARLSALETYVGIASAQLDAWRAYTSALIGFLEPAEPRQAADHEVPPAPPGPQDAAKPLQGVAPFFEERLADGAIARAEKAKVLKQAIDALRSTLSSEQLERLTRAERSFGPRHPFPGLVGQETDRREPGGGGLPPLPERD